jgi:hypothetical protein
MYLGSSSESGFRLRRISDSLQDLNISSFYPFLGDIESESEISFALAETGSDEEGGSSGYESPRSSTTGLHHFSLQEELEAEGLELDETSESSETETVASEIDEEAQHPHPLLPPTIQIQIPTENPIPLRHTLPHASTAPPPPPEPQIHPLKQLQAENHDMTTRGHVAKPKPENKGTITNDSRSVFQGQVNDFHV